MSLDKIQNAVRNENMLVILLVHKVLLKCELCHDRQREELTKLSKKSAFLGHYVVVYAWYDASNLFLIKDPSAMRDTCLVAARVLDEARSAFGTDSDVLFVKNRQPKHTHTHTQSTKICFE